MGIFNPLTIIKFSIGAAVIGAISFWYYGNVKEKEALQAQVVQLEVDKMAIKKNFETLQQINANNLKAMDELVAAEKKREAIERNLRAQLDRDQNVITNLKKKITKVEAKDDGPIANVLRDTITTLDAGREQRKGEVK